MAENGNRSGQQGDGTLEYLQSIVDTVREPLIILDAQLRIITASRSFYVTFRETPKNTEGCLIYELGSGQWDVPALRQLLEDILPSSTAFDDFEVVYDFPGLGRRTMLLNARKLYRPGNGSQKILLAFEDVTERRRLEAERTEAFQKLQAGYERERRIAEALQRPLLVEVAEDAFPGLEMATLYEAALSEAEVGGDLFDAFLLPRGLIALAIADASGKGLSAAARAIQIKDVLRALSREYPHAPNVIAARLNDYLCDTRRYDDLGDEAFICFCLAVLNPANGEGSILSAGCELPLILRTDGTVESLPARGMPLGVQREILYSYSALPFHLSPGDTLLLVTDGITEARQRHSPRAFLGYDGMTQLARQHNQASSTLRELGRAILEGAKSFSGGALRDDACLLLARKL